MKSFTIVSLFIATSSLIVGCSSPASLEAVVTSATAAPTGSSPQKCVEVTTASTSSAVPASSASAPSTSSTALTTPDKK